MSFRPQRHEPYFEADAFASARELTTQLHAELISLQRSLADGDEAAFGQGSAARSAALLERYARLTELDLAMDEGMRERALRHHRNLVQPFFLSVPIVRRSVDQPLGYPGDYLMVELLFGAGPSSTSTLGQALSEVILRCAPSRAHRHRAPWAGGWLERRAGEQQRPLRVLSFACGPERILRAHAESAGAPLHVVLCDHEPAALEHARAALEPLLCAGSSLQTIELSVAGLLRGRRLGDLLRGEFAQGFDVILVLGLFDYLRGSLVQRLMSGFHALLQPDGIVLSSNLYSGNPHRALMEYVAEWNTIHRSAAEFEALMQASKRFDLLELTPDPSGANLLYAGRRAR